jgi:hypothetical protein
MKQQNTKAARYCTVRASISYGVYPATLVDAVHNPFSNEVVLTFRTEAGDDIVRHSPVAIRNGKHGDLIRTMFAPEFIPDSTIANGQRCASLLASKLGHSFIVAYTRKDSVFRGGLVSVVPLHRGMLSDSTTGQREAIASL